MMKLFGFARPPENVLFSYRALGARNEIVKFLLGNDDQIVSAGELLRNSYCCHNISVPHCVAAGMKHEQGRETDIVRHLNMALLSHSLLYVRTEV